MVKRGDLKLPLFTVSPKTYFVGKDAISAARIADEVAAGRRHTIFYSAPMPELYQISRSVSNVLVTAQHADLVGDGKGMGLAPLESLKSVGVEAVFLNHTARPLCVGRLANTIDHARELEMLTIVAADSAAESKVIAAMNPDIILCEPSSLVGTGRTSEDSYISQTISAVRSVNKDVVIMEGAGVRNADDVRRLISRGAQGTGISSALKLAKDQRALLTELFDALDCR
ncbi:triose-phosphate isomerase [Olsenella uli]